MARKYRAFMHHTALDALALWFMAETKLDFLKLYPRDESLMSQLELEQLPSLSIANIRELLKAVLPLEQLTPEQAVALDQALKQGSRKLDKVLFIDVPEDELIRRLKGRYICRDCQAPHAGERLDVAGDTRCSRCGGELYQRTDDSEEGVRTRLEVYRTETVPVLKFYREQGLLADISGLGSVETVSQRVLEALGPELVGQS